MSGRHDAALGAGLLGAGRGGLAVPARELADGEKVAVPIGATGIIVGTTASGHPLLVDLSDPTELATVTIAGEFALLVQVALRAAATGYQVLVCTRRPQRWQQVTGAGLQVVGAGGLAEQLPASQHPYLVVYDGVGGPAPAGAAVTVRTVDRHSASGADIHLEQDGAGTAVIRTWAFQYRLRINLDYERRLTDAGSTPGSLKALDSKPTMTGIEAETPARSAFRRGLLASGIGVGGLVPSHNRQVAVEMFRTVTRAEPGVCDGWMGRVLAGEDTLEVLAGAWAAAETFGWEIRRLGVLAAEFRPLVFDGLFLQLPISSVDALRCAYATVLIREANYSQADELLNSRCEAL